MPKAKRERPIKVAEVKRGRPKKIDPVEKPKATPKETSKPRVVINAAEKILLRVRKTVLELNRKEGIDLDYMNYVVFFFVSKSLKEYMGPEKFKKFVENL
jgi:hypothetical protein